MARATPPITALAWLAAALAGCSHAGLPPAEAPRPPVAVRLLAINDFHGSLEPSGDGQAPGALQLELALRQASAGHPGRILVLHAGDLVADALRAAAGADLAAVNAGALRADLPAGTVTFGDLFAVLPFGGALVRVQVTGRQLRALLEQQWLGQSEPRRLHVSGFAYRWDARRPPGDRVVALLRGGAPIEDGANLSLALPGFLAEGGDGCAVAAAAAAAGQVDRGPDLAALAAQLEAWPQPLRAVADARIQRVR